MFRKLMKYELRAVSWLMPACLLAMVLLYGAGWAAKAIGIRQVVTALAVALILVGCASVVVALVTVVTRFYKGMFGAEGYLTQTLPVGKGSLIMSKAVVAYVLILLSLAMVLFSVFGGLQLLELLDPLSELNALLGGWGISFLVFSGIMLLVQLAMNISELYCAMTLANLRPCQSNGILFSVLFYFGLQMVVGMLEVVALLVLPIGIRFGTEGVSFVFEGMLGSLLEMGGQTNDPALLGQMTIGLGSLVLDAAVAVVLLIVTRWLMTRKISIK